MSEITLNDVVKQIEEQLDSIGLAIEKVEKLISEYAEDDIKKTFAILITGQMKMSHEILKMLQVICREIRLRDKLASINPSRDQE